MRILSERIKSELFREHGTLEFDSLLHIELGDENYYYHANPHGKAAEVVVGGSSYEHRLHTLKIPDDLADGTLENDLIIDNSDGTLANTFLPRTGIPNQGKVNHSIVFANEPEVTVLGPFPYDLVRAEVDEGQASIILGLSFDRLLKEPFPERRYTPDSNPGLW